MQWLCLIIILLTALGLADPTRASSEARPDFAHRALKHAPEISTGHLSSRIVDSHQALPRIRGGGDETRTNGWGRTSPDRAREAVEKGWALPLSTVFPTVLKLTSGQILEVDLSQIPSGEWRYEFLILTQDRRYQVVVVDAQRNQVTQVRSR